MLKRGLLALTSLLALLVPARAQELDVAGAEPLLRVFAAVFDKPYTPEIIILSFAMMIIFSILLTVLLIKTKIFEGFQPAAALVGGIFAFLTIRYTPLGFFFFILIAVIILAAGAFIFMMYDAVKKGMGISAKIGLLFMAIGSFVIGGLLIFASDNLARSGIEVPGWGGMLAWLCIILGIFILIGMMVTVFFKVKWPGTAGGPTLRQALGPKVGGKYLTTTIEELVRVARDLQYERKLLSVTEQELGQLLQGQNLTKANVKTILNKIEDTDRNERRAAALTINAERLLRDILNKENLLRKEGMRFAATDITAINRAVGLAAGLRSEERQFIAKIEAIERAVNTGAWTQNVATARRNLGWLKGYVLAQFNLATYIERVVLKLEQHIATQRS